MKALHIKDIKLLKHKLETDADFKDAALMIYTPAEINYIKTYKTPLQRFKNWLSKFAYLETLILVIIAVIAFLIFSAIAIRYETKDAQIRESDRMEMELNLK